MPLAGAFVLGIVATPFVFAAWLVHRIFEHRLRMKQVALAQRMPMALPPGSDVERRLANLEAVICDLDFDLAQRLREGGRSHAA